MNLLMSASLADRGVNSRRSALFAVVRTIARFTLLDALRSRWLWLTGALIAACVGAAVFFAQLALTEQAHVGLVMLAPMLRLAAVLVMVSIVVAATVREFGERSLLLVLAAPVSRPVWVVAKWTGFMLLGWFTAVLCAAPLLLFLAAGALTDLLAWTLSLGLELMLVCALALMCACALRQVPTALLACLCLILAARVIGAVVLLNERAPLESAAVIERSGGWLLDGLALLLPRLDLFTRTEWLSGAATVGAASMSALPGVLVQSVLYVLIALTITVIDFGARDA